MNILIVDGNEKISSQSYTEIGMQTQYELYKNVLKKIVGNEFNIEIIHPACTDSYMSQGLNIDDFQGIVWTGSSLNIYDLGPPIERQIELAKILIQKKNKIFGSCWGLQVLSTAAGGKVRKNPKGLEAVIAEDIFLNKKGIEHPMYANKPNNFHSFCWHYDELEELPQDAVILSSNNKSIIQSISFIKNDSEVWAVQYHPEFNPKWISGLMKLRKSLLLDEGIYKTSDQFDKIHLYLSDVDKYDYLKNELSIHDSLIERSIHTIELSNWVKNLKNDI